MKTLTYFQFLYMIENTHCNCISFSQRKGFWVVFLGFPVLDDSMFVVYKSRLFSSKIKRDNIIESAKLYGLTFLPYPTNIFSR